MYCNACVWQVFVVQYSFHWNPILTGYKLSLAGGLIQWQFGFFFGSGGWRSTLNISQLVLNQWCFEFVLQNHLVPSWKDDPIPLLQSIHDVRFPTIYDRKNSNSCFVVSLPSRINTVVGRDPAPVASWDIQNPVNTGILAIAIGAGFLPSTVKCILIHNHLRLIQRGSNRQQLLGIDTKNGLENCIFFQLCLFWGGIFVKFCVCVCV